ncbi:energy transducer TonB [Sphingomonas sp. AOB5]|uniref:energy transducer TonB n=1 Tax=Sphingomonas sp. AOB5 TaxID=3034017 RepID=UPI0023F97623|nr:energy transducer TonB [Sphingomonas sp. AOB5]MDF7774344.1 energy transducer TonB [Sphingomonas sp. AOB5]
MRTLAFAIPLIAIATPAAAQTPFGWSGSWQITQQGGACTLGHSAKDVAATRIELRRTVVGSTEFSASGAGWSFEKDRQYPIELDADGQLMIVHGIGWGIDDGPHHRGFRIGVYQAQPAKLLAARSIAVRADGEDKPAIAMPPGALALADLDRCIADLKQREAGSGAPARTPPKLRGTQDALMTEDDYPVAARRAEIGGRVRVRLTVGVYGFVRDCTVIDSSDHKVLDDATCAIYRRRARFDPAKDAAGRLTLGTMELTKLWTPPPMIRHDDARPIR